MKLKQLIAATTLAVSSASAFATPIYTGDTDAAGYSDSQLSSGYTIWNGEGANSSDWNIRWTSKNETSASTVSWFGGIVFYNSLLDTTSVSEYKWESHDGALQVIDTIPMFDLISWNALTNDTGGVDGFSFSLEDGIELVEFQLGSSLFDDLALNNSPLGTEATMITMGDQNDTVMVNVSNAPGLGKYQHVQVSVTEPGTLALLGLGLAGLGFARRKQA